MTYPQPAASNKSIDCILEKIPYELPEGWTVHAHLENMPYLSEIGLYYDGYFFSEFRRYGTKDGPALPYAGGTRYFTQNQAMISKIDSVWEVFSSAYSAEMDRRRLVNAWHDERYDRLAEEQRVLREALERKALL